jgi:Na+/H+-dicarboxylate symporter
MLHLAIGVGLVIFLAVVTLPLVYFVAGTGPVRYLKGTFGGVSIAVSTTSTAAALVDRWTADRRN